MFRWDPDLKIGVTHDIFQRDGKTRDLSEKLKMIQRNFSVI